MITLAALFNVPPCATCASRSARSAASACTQSDLDGFLAAGSEEGLSAGHGVVRTFPLTPADAPREEKASPMLGLVSGETNIRNQNLFVILKRF